MKKLFSTRIGAILTAVAMLIAMLPGTMAVMAAGEVTGDGAYIAVDELEHYALTVDNTTVADDLISVTVNFWKQGEGGTYSPVSITAYKSYNATAAATTSLDRYMCGADNTYNFTTPKDCAFVSITAVGSNGSALSLPVTLNKTTEAFNNGALVGGDSGAEKAIPGWYARYASYHYDKNAEHFEMESGTSTNIYQSVTLKAETTYRLSFKFAQKATNEEALKYNSPRVYFDKITGSTTGTLPQGEGLFADAPVLTAVPSADSDWTEYEMTFETGTGSTAAGMTGLYQARMLVRHYDAKVEGKTEGTAYYDDFSIVEVVETEDEDDGYIAVDELEHYALTVDNSTKADEAITATVSFWNKGQDGSYTAVKVNGLKYNTSSTVAEYTSIDRYMYGSDNVFNFTTPKNCNYVTVTLVDSNKEAVTLPVSVEKTNEVLNNGTLINTAGSDRYTRLAGWYCYYSNYYNKNNNRFEIIDETGTNVSQSVTLKAGATYKLTFKFAQSEASGQTLKNTNPRVYFDTIKGSTYGTLPRGEGMFEDTVKLTAAPSANGDWTEYEMYFVAGEAPEDATLAGLYQARMIVRHYQNTKSDSDATNEGYSYFDDFSLEEVDGGSYISYMNERYGYSVSGKSLADKVRYHYVKADGDKTRSFIYAEYEGDKKLSYVQLIPVSESGDYDIEVDDKTLNSKIFLFDSATLVPNIPAIED